MQTNSIERALLETIGKNARQLFRIVLLEKPIGVKQLHLLPYTYNRVFIQHINTFYSTSEAALPRLKIHSWVFNESVSFNYRDTFGKCSVCGSVACITSNQNSYRNV